MRTSGAPTTDGIFQALQGLRRHRLLDEKDRVLETLHDELPPVAEHGLQLLGVRLEHYGIPD